MGTVIIGYPWVSKIFKSTTKWGRTPRVVFWLQHASTSFMALFNTSDSLLHTIDARPFSPMVGSQYFISNNMSSSPPVLICGDAKLADRDAAMSLDEIGDVFLLLGQTLNSPTTSVSSSVSSSPTPEEQNIVEDDQSRTSDYTTSSSSHSSTQQRRTKGKLPPKKRRIVKYKQSNREAKVSFEEMKRLMRVYGPTKCLRNRTPKESGKSTKVLSIKRKFYRWFPDFNQRFVLQSGGWYKPLIGHEEEMKYREELRRKDQELLAGKRTAKKNS